MQLDAIQIEGGRGAILSTKESGGSPAQKIERLLPLVFESKRIAEQFLTACERAGCSLYPDVPAVDMSQLFRLWKEGAR